MKASYSRVADKIEDLNDITAVSLPDGSVDTYYRVLNGHSGFLRKKKQMAERIEDSSDFKLVPERKEPGGVSVNMAQQCHKLGVDVEHYGHTDDPVFETLDFERNPLGPPADVTICEFTDGDVLLAKENQDLLNWKIDEIAEDESELKARLSKDLICCANWATIPEMREEMEKIREIEPDAQLFNFDPGPLMNIDTARINELFEFLGLLDSEIDVIVHGSTSELEAVASSMDITGTEEEKVREIQERSDITGYVLHDKPRALAGTEDGVVEVKNLQTRNQRTFSGAGDRFDAAFGAAYVAGWDWAEALALGNLCAVNYIEKNSTAEPEDIQQQLQDKLG